MAHPALTRLVKKTTPVSLRTAVRRVYFSYLRVKYQYFARPTKQLETFKARKRRLREGFFDLYCQGRGIDVGYGGDLVCENAVGYDVERGDAGALPDIPSESFDFVYASHVLEHLADPVEALRNWRRVVRPGGYLIVAVPHRDLYEKRKRLPSRWNPDHKHLFLPDRDDPPDTIGLRRLLTDALPDAELIQIRVCDEGHTISDPDLHSDGEYSIEAIVRRK